MWGGNVFFQKSKMEKLVRRLIQEGKLDVGEDVSLNRGKCSHCGSKNINPTLINMKMVKTSPDSFEGNLEAHRYVQCNNCGKKMGEHAPE